MPGPAIKHTDLFDFDSYDKSIQEVKSSTVDFITAISKVTDTLNTGFNEAKSSLDSYKKSAQSTNNADSFAKLNKTIDETADTYNNLNDAIKGNNTIIAASGSSIKSLTDSAKQLKKQYDELDEEQRNNSEVGKTYIKNIAQAKAAMADYNNTLKDATKAMTTVDGSYSALSNELNTLRNQLKNLPGAFNASTGAINTENKTAVELAEKITKVDTAIKAMDSTMGQFGRNVGNYESGTVSLKEELRNLTQQMVKMKLAGEDNTDEYRNMADKAGELKDTMGDVRTEIQGVGSDTKTIEGLTGVMEGVAGGAAIAQGAMELFGTENDAVAESIKKLQSIQVLLNGVQAIGNVIQKESAAMLLITNAQKKLEVLATNLQTAAESKNIIVRKVATAAQWLLNKAMAANPVGILLVVVAALSAAIIMLTKNTKEQIENQIALNDTMRESIELQKESITVVTSYIKDKVDAQEEALKMNKASGASNAELAAQEEELFNRKIELAQNQYDIAKDSFENNEYFKEKNIKSLKDLEFYMMQTAQAVVDAKISMQKGGAQAAGIDDNYIKKLESNAALVKSQYDTLSGYNKSYEDSKSALREYYANQERIARERELKSESSYIDARVIKAKEGSYQEYLAKVSQIKEVAKVELSNVNLTEGERYKIVADKEQKLAKLKKEYLYKVKSEAIETQISLINSQLALVTKGSDEEYNLKNKLIERQYDLDKASIENSVTNEDLRREKIREIYNKMLADKKELEKEKNEAEINAKYDKKTSTDNYEILQQNEILANYKSTAKEKAAATQRLQDIEVDSIANEYQKNKELLDAKVIDEKEYKKRVEEIDAEAEQKKIDRMQREKELHQQLVDTELQTISSAVSAANQIYSDQLDSRISQLEDEKDAALDAADDNANAKARIEEEYTKKINKLKRKQAIADKISSLFNIGMNTATAIMKTAADLGYPAAIPFQIALGIQGAIQAAVVAAKPLPTYAKGTDNAPEGPAIVNDQPGSTFREMIVSRNRAFIPSKRNQVVYLYRGDKVIKADKTKGILSNLDRSMELNRIIQEQELNSRLSINIENGRKMEVEHIMTSALMNSKVSAQEIGFEVGKQLSGLPLEQNIWDDRGYRRVTKTKTMRVTNLNKRSSL
jgi:hypothetical protein